MGLPLQNILIGFGLLALCASFVSALPILRVAREQGSRPDSYFFHIGDGFHYHTNRVNGGVTYYKCVRFERGCRGRATFDLAEGFLHTAEHNHVEDPHYPDEMALRNNILRRCEALENVSFQTIIDEENHWYVLFYSFLLYHNGDHFMTLFTWTFQV